MRIITSATYRHLQQQAETANKVPGLETELENTKDKLTTYSRQHEDDTARIRELEAAARQADTANRELRQQLVGAYRAIAKVVTALTTTPGRDAAFHETARVISEHAEVLGLWPNQHEAVDVLVPRVAVLLAYGKVRSVHSSKEAAKAASCCGDSGWDLTQRLTTTTPLREMSQAIVTLPVYGPWRRDGSLATTVVLVINDLGVPVAAYGERGPEHLADGDRIEIHAVQEPASATA